ncbi:MAG: DEAD/DEAH box helicase family protein [Chloroflexota bacterium]
MHNASHNTTYDSSYDRSYDSPYNHNEAETRAELIDPALKAAGWGVVHGSYVRREREVIAEGRLLGRGRRAKKEIADYVLVYHTQKLAVIEAKRENARVTEGLGQAKNYAHKLQTRFAFATNGHGLYCVDMDGGREWPIEDGRYPSPDELWDLIYNAQNAQQRYWHRRFCDIPIKDKGEGWQPRYYQHNAINRVLDKVVAGKDRILLTLATGTGKTSIAFQIAWKLFQSRWNLPDWRRGLVYGQEPTRQPRILFLADRNILADQAFNEFNPFEEKALIRINPNDIRKKGRVPKNGNIFFTIFQTFMSGQAAEYDTEQDTEQDIAQECEQVDANEIHAYFGDYPPDFFDFIIIDECHRGGANDESTWRTILEHFAPAVQLGLTATPKKTDNANTYAYFGDPVYTYSLREGINDGYLTPFRVRQIQTTLDTYAYTADDTVLAGEVREGYLYEEKDFNRTIEIEARERNRVELFMAEIDQREKTIVFCNTQDHALMVRDLINQCKDSADADYCVRVTANDGKIGDQHLRNFQDNEKTIPTILTTSKKLSTGVDARNVRNIVLMRTITNIIEFKQIVGRGTRLYEGKDYFTIYDFVHAYKKFHDDQWDGDELEGTEKEDAEKEDAEKEDAAYDMGGAPSGLTLRDAAQGHEYQVGADAADMGNGDDRPAKVRIKLAEGKERTIQHMSSTLYYSPSGKPLSASQFVEELFGELQTVFNSEEDLIAQWSHPEARSKLLDVLRDKGYDEAELEHVRELIDAEDSDLFDVLAYIAFNRPPVSRTDRATLSRDLIFAQYTGQSQQDFLTFVLDSYIDQGVSELDLKKLGDLLRLKYQDLGDGIARLGGPTQAKGLFVGFQRLLYQVKPMDV